MQWLERSSRADSFFVLSSKVFLWSSDFSTALKSVSDWTDRSMGHLVKYLTNAPNQKESLNKHWYEVKSKAFLYVAVNSKRQNRVLKRNPVCLRCSCQPQKH